MEQAVPSHPLKANGLGVQLTSQAAPCRAAKIAEQEVVHALSGPNAHAEGVLGGLGHADEDG
eukprot:CAMPEP_0197913130 /NCGR_PEP_ID=MMETSP1439-20131203/76104_1 /TAXON_ID=66791 /ORGANISM="Gonyaulax spinifera, Strain CCMP409" /LENGTH=61 /DNA_ID=CAMNT_0043534963 /DNA_START=162 /DNA_END=344 /DNA_ORIENTATION=+